MAQNWWSRDSKSFLFKTVNGDTIIVPVDKILIQESNGNCFVTFENKTFAVVATFKEIIDILKEKV